MKKMNFIRITAVLICLFMGHGTFATGITIPDMPTNIMAVALFGTVTPFVAITIIVFIILYFRSRTQKHKYELLRKAIELGRDIPENFFNEASKQAPKNKLESAFMFLGIGLGVALLGLFSPDLASFAVPAGAIPFLMGVGKLLAIRIERRQQTRANPENE